LKQYNASEAQYRREFDARLKAEREKFDFNYDLRDRVDYKALAGNENSQGLAGGPQPDRGHQIYKANESVKSLGP
jgi:hypothetical protein